MAEIRLVKYRDKREELLDLFQASFGLTVSVELWNWKYLQNPLAPAVPELIVATDKGKIVGARPFMLAELWLGNERVKAAQPCDTMVHSQYRQEGIFSRMNQFAIEYFRREGYGMIVDYLVKDEDIDCFRLLMNECLNELEKSKCDLAFVWAFSRPRFREELLKCFGFKSPMKSPYNRFLGKDYFVAREVSEQVVKTVDIYNKEN